VLLIALIILSADIAPEPPIPPHPCPVAGQMADRMGIGTGDACDVEGHLRRAGWSDEWIAGALTNAWFESGWQGDAVGDHGHAVGFWQLRDDGLGSGMGDLRYDLRHSTDRVIRSARRQRLRTDKGDVRHAADKFCQLIMRPSDKVRKGEQRASAAARLSADDSI
jgi:hypothetical protein